MIRSQTPIPSTVDAQVERLNLIIICGPRVKTSRMKNRLKSLISSQKKTRFRIRTLSYRIYDLKLISLDLQMTSRKRTIWITKVQTASLRLKSFVPIKICSKAVKQNIMNPLIPLNLKAANIARPQLTWEKISPMLQPKWTRTLKVYKSKVLSGVDLIRDKYLTGRLIEVFSLLILEENCFLFCFKIKFARLDLFYGNLLLSFPKLYIFV